MPSVHLPSVLWRCWLGGRKGIRAVKTEVRCWHGYLCGARCRLAYGPTVSCSSKIQIGFTFLVYRPTRVVPEKGPLNGCVWFDCGYECFSVFLFMCVLWCMYLCFCFICCTVNCCLFGEIKMSICITIRPFANWSSVQFMCCEQTFRLPWSKFVL